jgi:hypothetical protein
MNGIIDSNQKIVSNGLILNLDAAQLRSYPTSGTTWTDISGSNNNGTLTNGPTFNSANGGSIVFDGTNDYVSGTVNIANSPFTIICWVYPNVTPSTNVYFSVGSIDATRTALHLRLVNDTSFVFGLYNDDLSATVSSVTNKWNYFAVTLTSGLIQTVYQNGVLVGSPRTAAGYFTGNTIYGIGRWSKTGPTQYINANVATSYVYNRALSATEIDQNYNATKSRFGL